MDKRLTERVERIGAIAALPEASQFSLIQDYIEDFHTAAWELVTLDRDARGKLTTTKKSSASLVKAYKTWLINYDSAWALADLLLAQPRTTDWQVLAAATGKSSETCRQAMQALYRGGLS